MLGLKIVTLAVYKKINTLMLKSWNARSVTELLMLSPEFAMREHTTSPTLMLKTFFFLQL